MQIATTLPHEYSSICTPSPRDPKKTKPHSLFLNAVHSVSVGTCERWTVHGNVVNMLAHGKKTIQIQYQCNDALHVLPNAIKREANETVLTSRGRGR